MTKTLEQVNATNTFQMQKEASEQHQPYFHQTISDGIRESRQSRTIPQLTQKVVPTYPANRKNDIFKYSGSSLIYAPRKLSQ